MNTPSSNLKPLTGYGVIDGLTSGAYWILDSSNTLTWALSDFGAYQWVNPSAMAVTMGQAYSTFSQYIPVNFSYTGHYTQPNSALANLVVSLDGGNSFFSNSNQWAEGFFPNPAIAQHG